MMYRSRDDKEGTIVYVGGLLAEVKKEDIESEFEKFGKLLRVWVAFNPPGFAFVEFSSKEDAETAVNALHNATILGSKLRVEISRGRGKGGRGGRGSDRGSRGGFRGGRGPEFSRGRGLSRGGFGGRPSPYDRNGDLRGRGGMGGRFDDYEDRRREFDERPLGARRDRDFGDIDPPRFGGSRDFRDIGGLRGYGDRDIGGRDFPSRDIGGRDFPTRDIGGRDFAPRDIGGIPPRDIEERDFIPRNFSRDFGEGREGRDLRDFGADRDVNGMRGFGGNPRELGSGRDYPVSQAPIPGRDFGAPGRDIGGGRNFGARDVDDLRDYSGNRDIGMRRDAVRDFNQPRDIDNSRDFGGGMPPRVIDYGEPERFGAGGGRGGFGDRGGQRPGGFDAGRFSGGDIGGSGNYDGYNARDRFRSRSPIGRGRPMY